MRIILKKVAKKSGGKKRRKKATGKSDGKKVLKNHAKYGWYRYTVRFALPVYNDKTGTLERYNIYKATMLVRHADDNNKYLYDYIGIKKETSSPPES